MATKKPESPAPTLPALSGFTIDNFPVKLREECRKVAFIRDMTLTQFTVKWMQFGLEREKKELAEEQKYLRNK